MCTFFTNNTDDGFALVQIDDMMTKTKSETIQLFRKLEENMLVKIMKICFRKAVLRVSHREKAWSREWM